MAPQHLPTKSPVSTKHGPRSFWLITRFALPALNAAVLYAVEIWSGLFVPVAAALALVELVALIELSSRYGTRVPDVRAAMLGNAAMTGLGYFLIAVVHLSLMTTDGLS